MTSIEGLSKYLIYENGDVYSKYRKRNMKTQFQKDGYKIITIINDDNKKITMRVHRLVALAYISNPENKPQVDHIDQNKTNNHISNLRWVTHSENQQNIKQPQCDNKLNEKFISIKKNTSNIYYQFQKTINGVRHYKNFKTLEEAIEYRDNYVCS